MSNFLATLGENFKTLFSNPLTIITLIGCAILLIAFIKFKSLKFDSKLIARIGLAIALAFILDMIKIYTLPNGGGSISLGSMVPILLLSFIYGPSIGLFTGFLFGVFKLILDPYILNPIQVLFDYPLPFMAVGIAGFFKNKYIGASIGMFLRFISHFISGVIFFGSYAPEGMSPIIYSLVVNGSAVGGELLICLVLLAFLPIERLIKTLKTNVISS
ncbi:energy-coupled thiamine transporter ThiT [Clostridium celatum]|uniref:Putative proton-coupled thiamine transporter YuaJ n=1 Tax=Clostridium celatum DSM 1785 TaxID=545697 RepID=L1QJ24_9CLOT|nr:energy-coupled thiamine transporter ThiT [Clostridium celatum]EKY27931.1 putative proton-coupled thiamine transporter YuaJ [Clostridium celatum DSM 1785]MCE9654862.1 energy-coupled thiamine transporter ThiT [Clostridium celatum]MDU2265040.1 energy-coupled thiamine transporter ThiT [Clostridium celatum]MDU3722860.1 energy-coupled thiamine transporter ThiT [Clostridium celatum]MDU6294532.1 energy-coupled thiamine transporter ThiT [Clostridium celatum]